MTEESDIVSLFNPKSIVVIGASENPAKIGYSIIDNIASGGYSGKVYPVNPKGGYILGYPVYKEIKDIPENEIDIVCISIPANKVFSAVQECTQKKVKFLVIITSGFSEIGNTDEERKIVKLAHKHGMRVLGPNMFGIYTKSVSLNATFGPKNIRPGSVAILTQSGALGIGMIGKTSAMDLGLSTIVSMGNKSDIDETDLLEYLADDPETKVIIMYMEGVKNGTKLINVLKKVTKQKNVIVIKSGRSKRGAMATASHTGSLAGEDAVFDAIMKQCGVIRAETIKEALEWGIWSEFMLSIPLPKGDNSIIITNGGGLGVLATDACEKYQVNLYDDQARMSATFQKAVSSFGSTKNPIDLTGQATAEDYRASISAAINDPNIHAVISLYCETAVFDQDELAKVIEEKYEEACRVQKPIVFSLFGGAKLEKYIKELSAKQIPVFGDVYDAINCLSSLYTLRKNILKDIEKIKEFKFDQNKIDQIVEKARSQNRYFLLTDEAQEVMRIAGITIPHCLIAKNEDEAVKFAEEINYPVVMKVVSKDIIHKSDAGAVKINIKNKEEVIKAYQEIMKNSLIYNKNADITGIEVVEMVKDGTQVIVGARQDQSFNSILMFGMGGIFVEVLKDVVFKALPIGYNEAKEMVMSIKSKAILEGVRGEKPRDIASLVDVLLKVGQILKNSKNITDIEINPVIVYEEGIKAVDVRILLRKN